MDKTEKDIHNVIIGAANLVINELKKNFNIRENNDDIKKDEGIPADKIAAKYIVSQLRKKYKTATLFGEEDILDIRSDYGFIIDPLDGTGNASGKRPHLKDIYGISIAYFEGNEVKNGIVFFPKRDILFPISHALKKAKKVKNLKTIIVSGGNYEHLLSENEKKRVKNRIDFFNKMKEKFKWKNTPRYCATYESLGPASGIYKVHQSHIHWSPTILYAWDIAATALLNKCQGNVMINLETMKEVNIIEDFGIFENIEKAKKPIGAITGHPKTIEKILNMYST